MKMPLKSILSQTVLGLFVAGLTATAAEPKKVLVVTVTAGFRHSEGIDASEIVLPKLAEQSGAFTLDWCRQPTGMPNAPQKPKGDADTAVKEKYEADLAKFKAAAAEYQRKLKSEMAKLSPEGLKSYDAVIFNNTTGDLPLPDVDGFLKWIESGKGFMGIHAATDTFRGHKPLHPYVQMIGAEFRTHGAQAEVDVINQDAQHPACKPLPPTFRVFDEIYLVNAFDRSTVHGLLTLDKHPNEKTPGDYPIAWCKPYGKGRVLYTSLGHRADVWDDDPKLKGRKNPPEIAKLYQQHLVGALQWVLGLAPGDATPQVK